MRKTRLTLLFLVTNASAFHFALRACLSFVFVFSIIMMAFSMLFSMVFGSSVSGFRDKIFAGSSLLKLMLGEFDFDELQASHWLLGPLFFFAFITFCVFVVANVIIAIIVESYHDARHAVDTEYVDSLLEKNHCL